MATTSEPSEVQPFRTEARSTVVSDSPTISPEFSALPEGTAQVSNYSLELYLNACSPTCHG
ncbi:hypothetical protein GCM10027059_12640 [Myceligenerans halotolerans]